MQIINKNSLGCSQYNPLPEDVSDVFLPENILSLVEALAENVHETWARGRIDDGWRYGNVRNDIEKLHPCPSPILNFQKGRKIMIETRRFRRLSLS